MTTDRELLELAAKAAGLRLLRDPHGALRDCTNTEPAMNIFSMPLWNTLTDDGDEARLEAALQMHVEWHPAQQTVSVGVAPGPLCTEPYGEDRQAARRRSGVRAAAELGMES